MNNKLDLFEFLKYILDFTYIFDLRTIHYNNAKLILKQLNLK